MKEYWIKLEDSGDNPFWKVFAPGVWLNSLSEKRLAEFTHVVEHAEFAKLQRDLQAARERNGKLRAALGELAETKGFSEVMRIHAVAALKADDAEYVGEDE